MTREARSIIFSSTATKSEMAALSSASDGVQEPAGSLLVALDVGQRNLSLCALRCPLDFSSIVNTSSTPLLRDAKILLQHTALERWEVVSLNGTEQAQTFAERCKAIAEFVKSRKDLFAGASAVIVEHQMHSLMRCLAAALFAAIHVYASESAKVVSQHSNMKLQWRDVTEHCRCANPQDLKKYNVRKRAAVECAEYLLKEEEGPGAGAHEKKHEDLRRMRDLLDSARKKDDLADALLHALAYGFKAHAAPAPKRRRAAKGAVTPQRPQQPPLRQEGPPCSAGEAEKPRPPPLPNEAARPQL